jgi:hypothetical protein
MTIIARGAEKVLAYERALGGAPPKEALKIARSQILHYFEERSKKQKEARSETAPLIARKRDLLLKHSSDESKLKSINQELKRIYERRNKRKLAKPRLRKIEPCVIVGSNFIIHAPPYDGVFSSSTSQNPFSEANANAGTYDLGCQSFGDGNVEAGAGVASWFFCASADPQQRFAALVDYSDDWWDSADGYVAHNNLRTRLWVWGATENTWVCQAEVSPGWSDGVGWFESHGNDPVGEQGRLSVETFFPVMDNSWYHAWVWGDASADSDGGFWGFGASSIQFSASIPLMVFGSL